MCLSCRAAAGPLCRTCRASLAPVAPATVAGVPVRAAFRHDGAAAALVHSLKYGASRPAAALLATVMARHLAASASPLVPIPRTAIRRWRYGIDPALELAVRLAALTGLPVAPVLQAQLWHPRQAGRRRRARQAPVFRVREAPPPDAVLIDDVMTTGATLRAALDAVPTAIGVITATRAEGTSLSVRTHITRGETWTSRFMPATSRWTTTSEIRSRTVSHTQAGSSTTSLKSTSN